MTSPNTPPADLDIAVAHGNYFARGGGERVAEAIAWTFDAPIYYGFGDDEHLPEDIECQSVFESVPGAGLLQSVYQLRDLYYMYGWRSVPELHDYDVVIQSGNEPGWYKAPDDQVIVKYTHSTPRNAYDRYPDRAPNSGLIYEAYCFASEQLYQPVVDYPDQYIANSEIIQRRLDKYWGVDKRNSRVIYPPVNVEALGPENATHSPINEDYYVVLDRLVETKHVDQIIDAFRSHPDERLVIAGTGGAEDDLHDQARDMPHVSFRGYVDETEKRALLADAEALVYAAEDEDFGIVPIEAMASGTPVIGPREGFTQFQIADGETGLLYDRGPGAIATAVERFDERGVSATTADLTATAAQYSAKRFKRELTAAVADAVASVAISQPKTAGAAGEPAAGSTPAVAATDGGEVDGDS